MFASPSPSTSSTSIVLCERSNSTWHKPDKTQSAAPPSNGSIIDDSVFCSPFSVAIVTPQKTKIDRKTDSDNNHRWHALDVMT
mmetsp:Transcript_6360/g.18704  ORF Transcript_6360/g.18704 Transcript_6360/m.18704 type:complete len:83 (-) Transcript_6360:980-1228(-)